MGHSVQAFRGKADVLNDIDLLVVIGLGLDIIDHTSRFISLGKLGEEWRLAQERYGPGIIDLKLDELLETDIQRRDFIELLDQLLSRATQFGEAIAEEFLHTIVPVPGMRFHGDYKLSFVHDSVEKLKKLITER